MEKQKFEEGWKDAFQGAEVSPSDGVWTNIELDLEKGDTTGMRQKLLFYKTLAAASVIFALAMGGAGVYFFQVNQLLNAHQVAATISTTDDQMATPQNNSSQTSSSVNEIKPSDEVENKISSTSIESEGHVSARPKKYSTNNAVDNSDKFDNPDGRKELIVSTQSTIENTSQEIQFDLGQRDLPTLVNVPKPALRLKEEEEKAEVDPVVAMMARLEARENEIQEAVKKDKTKKEQQRGLWTSVGLAAGSFDASDATINQPLASANLAGQPPANSQGRSATNTAALKEARASGFAYSAGLNVGKKISKRFLVQGGVNYLTQISNYTSETAVTERSYTSFRPEVLNDQSNSNSGDLQFSDSRIVSTAPHRVSNNMRYLSVPVQAGYVLLDKRIGFQLNAGISTDLFLQYTKSADVQIDNGQNFEKVDAGRDDADSPYRPVNFSGLFGTEFIYKFGERYRVSLNPGVRYPLSSVYKSNLGIQSTPLSFDVGLRFRYIFH